MHPRMSLPPALRRFGIPLLVGLLGILAFAAVVPGGHFVFDDHVLIETNSDLVRGDVWWKAFQRDYYSTSAQAGRSGYYRPLVVLLNAAEKQTLKWHSSRYHWSNLVLHGVTSAVLGPVLITLGAPAAVAWSVAALFAVHPVHAESVAFISGRVDVMATLGMLAALAFMGSRWRFAPIGLGVAALFAFLSKESAVVLPLLVLVAWMARPRAAAGETAEEANAPSALAVCVAVGGAALVALLARWAALGTLLPATAAQARPQGAGLLPIRALGFALESLYAPVRRLLMEPDPAHLQVGRILVSILIAAVLWGGAWRFAPATRPFLRRAAWCSALALLPVINILPQETMLSERFFYLAAAFALAPAGVLVVEGWKRAGPLRPLVAASFALVTMVLFGISVWRARAWRDDVILWRIAAQEEPNRAAFWDRLGLALTERHEFAPAEEALRRSVALDPKYFNSIVNLGVLLHMTHRPREAVEFYQKALAIDPNHVDTHLNLGLSLMDMGRTQEAYEQFQKAAALKPDNPEALRLAGIAALQFGRLDDARRYLEAARRYLPDHPGIRQSLVALEEAERRRTGTPPPQSPAPAPH